MLSLLRGALPKTDLIECKTSLTIKLIMIRVAATVRKGIGMLIFWSCLSVCFSGLCGKFYRVLSCLFEHRAV